MSAETTNTLDTNCPICWEESNGTFIDYHTYFKYIHLWLNSVDTTKQPLIKCIKCQYYTCLQCKYKLKACPANCHELGLEPTIIRPEDIYRRFAVYRELDYANEGCMRYLWLS